MNYNWWQLDEKAAPTNGQSPVKEVIMTEMHPAGPGPITPRQEKEYKKEYLHGEELFQKALHQAAKTEPAGNPYQQEQFRSVMNDAMNVLNQSARALKRDDLIKQNAQIAHDFSTYKAKPTKEAQQKLNQDLDAAKKSIS